MLDICFSYKKRIEAGFFLKEKNWAMILGFEFFFFQNLPKSMWFEHVCIYGHICVPRAYLHTWMQKWFTVGLMQIFSFPSKRLFPFFYGQMDDSNSLEGQGQEKLWFICCWTDLDKCGKMIHHWIRASRTIMRT